MFFQSLILQGGVDEATIAIWHCQELAVLRTGRKRVAVANGIEMALSELIEAKWGIPEIQGNTRQ